jgi:phage terminase small subunit
MAAPKVKKPNKRVKPGTSREAAEHRRRLFVEAYIANGGNATEAAKAAGFSAKTAYSQGQRLLKDVEVNTSLSERRESLAKKYELTAESVIAELAKIVHADPRKLFDENGNIIAIRDWEDDMAGAVASVEFTVERHESGDEVVTGTKKVKLWDKNSAIEKAMKHLGLFERDNEQQKTTVIIKDFTGTRGDD